MNEETVTLTKDTYDEMKDDIRQVEKFLKDRKEGKTSLVIDRTWSGNNQKSRQFFISESEVISQIKEHVKNIESENSIHITDFLKLDRKFKEQEIVVDNQKEENSFLEIQKNRLWRENNKFVETFKKLKNMSIWEFLKWKKYEDR